MLVASIVLASGALAATGAHSYPCGVAQAREVLAFATPRDPEQIVEIDPEFGIRVARQNDGRIEVHDTASGVELLNLPAEDVAVLARIADDGKVVRARARGGTLFVDSRALRKGDGAWIYFCWKPDHPAPPEEHAEEYLGLEIAPDQISATITRVDESSLPAPQIQNQLRIESPIISPDHRTLGWLVTAALSSAFFPTDLIIYRAGKIAADLRGGYGDYFIGDWAFVRDGAAVSYYTVWRFGDFQRFHLVDIENGAEIATYEYPDSSEGDDGAQKRAAAVSAAPDWVKQTPRSDN
jgi:hypothetical protein